ncbi:MAG: BBP7 family outer membrane beta-barrel protein, partial [Pirellulaceae bacterium]
GSDSCTTGVSGDCGSGCGCGWFGSVGALILGPSSRCNTYLSYDSATYLPVLTTSQTNGAFGGGIDITAGKMLGCGNWGASFTYWGVYPSAARADVYNTDVTGNLGSYLNFGGLTYNANPGTNYWNAVVHQRIVTNQTINSAEINLLGNCGCGLFGCDSCVCGGPCGPRLGMGWTMGLRYFQFNDDFNYYSDNLDNVLDGSINEMQYRINTRNSLYGFQVGGGLNYRVWNCFSLYGIGKAGIYNNRASVSQAIYGSGGDATVNVGPYAGTAYRFQDHTDNLAFLGQLDLGGRYQMSRCWSINGGYRMVGISGLALTDGQIPSNFAYVPDAQRVNACDSLILHGGYVGATFCW